MDTHAPFCIAIENDGTPQDNNTHSREIANILAKLGIADKSSYSAVRKWVVEILPIVNSLALDIISRNPAVDE
jgi:hypothetical protein